MTTRPQPPLSRWRWLWYVAGTAMMAWGVWGQVFGADTKPTRVAVLWVAAALGHDLLLAPIIVLLGWVARQVLPGRIRGTVQGAALVAGVLVLLAIPALGRYGEKADNPSVLPRDYRAGLLVALSVVALVAAVHALTARRSRRTPTELAPELS